MSEKVALIGFVNTEEVLADVIRTQTPYVEVHGYELFPNEAFGRIVHQRRPLYGVNEQGEFGLNRLDQLQQLGSVGYRAINLGPIPAAHILEDTLIESGVDYVGPRKTELDYELDKRRIFEVFPPQSEVLPPTVLLEKSDQQSLREAVEALSGDVVVKFIGDYTEYYQDSETRRVRMLEEFDSLEQLQEFVANSVNSSGCVMLQQRISGTQFSHTLLVDGNDGTFRLGENICYKHRYDGDTGPLGDGTGSISIDNTLPGVVSDEDVRYIEQSIVRPYVDFMTDQNGRAPKTFLNIDLIKDSNTGKVYLLEVNNREPGGHTAAGLLTGLQTPLFDALQATQEGRLADLSPRYKSGASVVVSAYPENFPQPFTDDNDRPNMTLPKLQPDDAVKIYTGWVDLVNEDADNVEVKSRLSPTALFTAHAPSLTEASSRVYQKIDQYVPAGFDYRRDIGR